MAGATSEQKIIEIILYIAERVNSPTILQVCKLLYLADLDHMQRYGRFISGDYYVAMKNGPVPSKAYDIMKGIRNSLDDADSFQIKGQFGIITKRQPDLDELSESDEECLNRAIEKYGGLNIHKLIDLSHDPAWLATTNNGAIFDDSTAPNAKRMDLRAIIKMFPNTEEITLHLERQGCLST